MTGSSEAEQDSGDTATTRRSLLQTAPAVAMTAGLLASYGTFAAMAGRFLYPAKAGASAWQFVTQANQLKPGDSLPYHTPKGAEVRITRQAGGELVALSSTCPHLGCEVHWEPHNDRFFCPCHNGVFDPSGTPTEGPPAQAGQSLPRYQLKEENGLLFIEVPVSEKKTDGRQS